MRSRSSVMGAGYWEIDVASAFHKLPTDVGLVFSPDPHQQIVNMLSELWCCVELPSAFTALRSDHRLLQVQVVKVEVTIGVHKV